MEYTLSEDERRHISEVHAQIQQFDAENLRLEGTIRRNETELSMMRRHVSLMLGHVAAANGLPMGARLSSDGTKLVSVEPEATPVRGDDGVAG